MANFVQLYKSTDLNAPVSTGAVGGGLTVTDGCLVSGYSTAAITSITNTSSTVATAVLTTADPTLVTGQWVTIASATGTNAAQYNGTWQITVISTTSFSYVTSGLTTTATGSPTYNKAPLGWAHPFSAGTHSQSYRSADTSSNRFYLQIDDNGARTGAGREISFYGAEVMSANDTVTSGQFPTAVQFANGYGMRKSTTADSTARAWTLIGDDRTFYWIPNSGDSVGSALQPMGFGYFIPFKSGDAYNTFVLGNAAFIASSNPAYLNGISMCYLSGTPGANGLSIARLYTQTGSAVAASMTGYSAVAPGGASPPGSNSNVALAYPNPPDSGMYCAQMLVLDGTASLRGRMPGLYQPLHFVPFQNYDQITGVTGLSGVTLTALTLSSDTTVGQVLVDTFGPWN
jgi:hypothetical protein